MSYKELLEITSISDLIKRRFTKELENNPNKTVYDLFKWKTVNVHMENKRTGEVLLDMKGVEFPAHYSQNACNIIASKYFRKTGVPNGVGHERSMKEVAHRMVNFWVKALVNEGMITENEGRILYDELVYAFLNQMWAPNSPQWFNTGLYLEYGIKGNPDGMYYYDPEKREVVESKSKYERTQASACFILSIEDKLIGENSISENYVVETKLFKGGSGTGSNYSHLRAKGEKLSGGGVSSGMLSFIKGHETNAGTIKSGGTTRRAAKMVVVNEDHPEVMDFINWKKEQEQIVRDLVKMGYDVNKAYEIVSGQNINGSIRLTNEFMKKVEKLKENPESEIMLRGRVDSSVDKPIKVKDLWHAIGEAAWICGDPAVQFHNHYNEWHTCPINEYGEKEEIESTNPCSEYAFLNNTACNLASKNVYKFYNPETGEFDIEGYLHLTGLIQLMLEASIHWGHFPTKDIARRSYLYRTTGIGIANLASLLMASGIPYNSEEGRTIAATLMGITTGYSYYVSSLMARQVGAFEQYEPNKEYMLKVIRNHCRVAGALKDGFEDLSYEPLKVNHKLLKKTQFKKLSEVLKKTWINALNFGMEYGYRNAQVSVVAPTGTISFAMDCTATSIEPVYAHVVYKTLSEGEVIKIVNPIVEVALKTLGYTKKQIKDIKEYMLDDSNNGSIKGAPHLKKEHYPIFETANEISPEGHVLMVAALTPMLSGSISKTVNMPNTATVEDIKNVYFLAWKTGVKAISIYRDGSKAAQPLNTTKIETERKIEDMTYQELLDYAKKCSKKVPIRRKMHGRRIGATHSAKIGDVELYVTVNFFEDGKMGEIFVSTDKDGTIVKGLLSSLSKALSHMLQNNIPPQEIIRMLRGQKYEPSGFVERHEYIKSADSISDLISRIIEIEMGNFSRCQVKPKTFVKIHGNEVKEIIKEKTKNKINNEKELNIKEEIKQEKGERIYGEYCANCGSDRLRRNGTCKVCEVCGSTTGCS